MVFKNRKIEKENVNDSAAETDKSKVGDISPSQAQQEDDLGFGSKYTNPKVRLINQDGSFNISRTGAGFKGWNGYIWLVTTSWFNFFLIIIASYVFTNAAFAAFYLVTDVNTLSGVSDYVDAFFFSVQTFTTVGYGSMSPIGISSNLIAALNALVGLMGFALATGLFFARFSRASASILFSRKAIIAPYKKGKGLMFRIANMRNNQLLEVEAQVSLTWIDTKNNQPFRRYKPLELERSKVRLFPLNWTIVHPIDEKSPIYKKDMSELKEMDIELIVMIKGFDETFAQYVHEQSSYKFDEMSYGCKFLPMYHVDTSGQMILELDKIDATTKVTFS